MDSFIRKNLFHSTQRVTYGVLHILQNFSHTQNTEVENLHINGNDVKPHSKEFFFDIEPALRFTSIAQNSDFCIAQLTLQTDAKP